jgi:hypothetical protein
MGFQVGRTFELDFTDTDADGAVVRCRSASIATIREMFDDATDLERETQIIADHIVEWNLEDGGVPIPVSVDGLLMLEQPFKNLIAGEWLKATRGISVPFDRRSPGGGKQPAEDNTEPFIRMEPE